MLRLLFIAVGLFVIGTSNAQITVEHSTADKTDERYSQGYLIGDRVSLRSEPSTQSSLLKTLPIGTALTLLSMTDSISKIDSLQSHWYKVKTRDGEQGYIWGGYIAYRATGSNGDPEVKFLLGFSHAEYQQYEGSTEQYPVMMGQLRAVKNNVQLDKITFYVVDYPSELHYISANFSGSKGIKGIDDIITVEIPCLGGCGCSGGTHHIFWDGKKLTLAQTVWGTADADFSEGAEIIYPSDMDGVPGYVVHRDDKIVKWFYGGTDDIPAGDDEAFLYGFPIIKRQITNTYYRWDGKALVMAKDKQPVVSYRYYDIDKSAYIPQPTKEDIELWGAYGYYNEDDVECEMDSSTYETSSTAKTTTLVFTFSEYCPGAAHGYYGEYYTNYWKPHLYSGRQINLEDVLVMEDSLLALAARSFSKVRGIPIEELYDGESLTFSLPKNFVLEQERITFVYQIYEVASYAEGMISFSLNYKEINQYLTPDFKWLADNP